MGIVLALEVAASIVRHRSYGPTKVTPTRNKREAKRESLDRVQLGHQSPWQIETNPDLTSEVEVRFFAETPNRTRVELEHRNLDRHGFGWEAVRGGVDAEAGWSLYLQRYAALLERVA